MSNLIPHIDLIEGLNLNPIPLEASNSMTTLEWLMAIQAKLNSIIDMGNAWESNANSYTDDEIKKIRALYDGITLLIDNGNIVKDGTISMKKMNLDFLSDLQDIVIKAVHDSTRFVGFSIDNNGYFCADMPDTWDNIIFSTDIEGHLCLDVT